MTPPTIHEYEEVKKDKLDSQVPQKMNLVATYYHLLEILILYNS